MDPTRFLPVALAAALFTAGCIGADDGPDAATAPNTPDLATAVASIASAAEGCHQLHLYFLARGEDFANEAPAGFEIPTDAQGMTQVRVEATRCTTYAVGTGAPVEATTVFIDIGVRPPEALTVPDATHLLTLEAYTDHPELAAALVATGFARAEATDIHWGHSDLGATRTTWVHHGASHGTYDWKTWLSPSSGTFEEGRVARFGATDGTATGRMVIDHTPSVNVGFGTVTETYQGSGGAPPVLAGIAHEVRDEGLAVRLEAIA